jgi:hypothetical protein
MKNWKKLSLLVLLLSGLACKKDNTEPQEDTYVPISVGKFLDNWTCSINPGVGANFDIGEFRLWVPDITTVSNLKAVLVVLDHVNSNGLGMVNDSTWRKYATANNVALLSVHLENTKLPTNYPYADARNGSGKALILAVEAIAQKNSISSVAALPFLIRGYSAGGMFGYFFSAFKPSRVVAFSNIRGWYIMETPDENKTVPALFLMAEQDVMTDVPPDNVLQLVIKKRYAGGLWAFAQEPGASHYSSLLKSDSLTRQFFSAALSKRTTNGITTLLSIPQESGWLGNNASNEAVPYDNYTANKKAASWLIDENVAKAWIAYQKK